MKPRDLAPTLVEPKSGLPLIRSVPDLGWQPVRIKGRIDVESSLKPETKRKRIYWAWKRFVQWLEKEGAIYKGNLVIKGPFPHAELKEPTWQYGSDGGKRLVARSLTDAIGQDSREDYVMEATFIRKEWVQGIDVDIAAQVVGKRGIRLARPQDLALLRKDR